MTDFSSARRSRLSHIGISVLAVVALFASRPAGAQYVLYHAVHGDWAVTCARELLTPQVSCTLVSPPPSLGPTATISIGEGKNAPPSLTFRLPPGIDPGRPVLALIDTRAPAIAESNRYGEGGWQGSEAASLIETLRLGNRLSLAWMVEGDIQPHTVDFALGSFDAALADYRQRLGGFGLAVSR